jgi:hypothetical protein
MLWYIALKKKMLWYIVQSHPLLLTVVQTDDFTQHYNSQKLQENGMGKPTHTQIKTTTCPVVSIEYDPLNDMVLISSLEFGYS